jgi:hypothetical protein
MTQKIRHPVERHSGEESLGTEHGNPAQGYDKTEFTNPKSSVAGQDQAAMANNNPPG